MSIAVKIALIAIIPAIACEVIVVKMLWVNSQQIIGLVLGIHLLFVLDMTRRIATKS